MERSAELGLRADIVDLESRTRAEGWDTSISWNQLPLGGKCPVKDRQAPKINFKLVGYFCFPTRRTTQFGCTNIYEPDTVKMGTLRWIRLSTCMKDSQFLRGDGHGENKAKERVLSDAWTKGCGDTEEGVIHLASRIFCRNSQNAKISPKTLNTHNHFANKWTVNNSIHLIISSKMIVQRQGTQPQILTSNF